MKEANFFSIFVGIESPDTDTLLHMQKPQNTRRVLQQSVERIYARRLFSACRLHLRIRHREGAAWRSDDPVHRGHGDSRLHGGSAVRAAEHPADAPAGQGRPPAPGSRSARDRRDRRPVHVGSEFHGRSGPREEVLADYRAVLDRIYAPGDYFARVRRMARQLDCSRAEARHAAPRHVVRDARTFLRMAWRMGVRNRETRVEFWRTFIDGLCTILAPSATRARWWRSTSTWVPLPGSSRASSPWRSIRARGGPHRFEDLRI